MFVTRSSVRCVVYVLWQCVENSKKEVLGQGDEMLNVETKRPLKYVRLVGYS